MKRVTKVVNGNSVIPSTINTVRVIHNLNNTAPFVLIREELTSNPIITKVETSLQSLLIYGLEEGKSYVVTIIG